MLVLVVTGVAGTIYKVITSANAIAIGALALVGLLAWISRGWAMRGRNRYAEAFVYCFAVAGLVFVARLWSHGTI